MLNGIMLGLALFLVAHASVPSKLPEPPKKESRTCEENILYRLDFYSKMLVELRVPYIWGGYWGKLGVDCSGYMYWICHMAGLPVKRTTSYRMWLDKGSWPGERVFVKFNELERAQFPNVAFFTYDVKRPFGHTVLVVMNALDKQGRRTILFREASSSAKIVKDTEMKQGDYRWVRVEGFIVLDLTPGFDCKRS